MDRFFFSDPDVSYFLVPLGACFTYNWGVLYILFRFLTAWMLVHGNTLPSFFQRIFLFNNVGVVSQICCSFSLSWTRIVFWFFLLERGILEPICSLFCFVFFVISFFVLIYFKTMSTKRYFKCQPNTMLNCFIQFTNKRHTRKDL